MLRFKTTIIVLDSGQRNIKGMQSSFKEETLLSQWEIVVCMHFSLAMVVKNAFPTI
jgi:hypothetical protein